MLFQRSIIFFLLAFLLTGYPGQVIADENIQQKWLPFIKDRKTTKEEVLFKLGIPSGQFEGERILVYKMMFEEKKGFKVVSRYISSISNPLRKTMDPNLYLDQWHLPDTYISMYSDPRFLQQNISEYHLVLVFDKRNVLQRHSLLFIKPS